MSKDVLTNRLETPATTYSTIGPAQRTAAKVVGFLYLIQMATGVFGQSFVRGQLIVPGNAAKTSENIIQGERLFRLSIAGDLFTYTTVIVLIWALYVLLRPVNRNLALLAAFFRIVENAVLCIATVSSLAALRLLSGADYLKTFQASQLQSLAMLSLVAQGLGMYVGFILLGLGSSLFAYLLLKSGYVPKALAGWGIFASLLLSLGTLAIQVYPGFVGAGITYMIPMGFYEVGLGLWLLVKGIRSPAPVDLYREARSRA